MARLLGRLRSCFEGRQGAGLLALGVALSVRRVQAEDEEPASPMDIAMAATLIGAVSFQMLLFHLTNHEDKDMRKYTYMVINQTVSIFCSVLMFSTCNDIVQQRLLAGLSAEQKVVVNMFHMLCWFLALQFLLAIVCGAIGEPAKDIEKTEERVKCFGTLLAHITGFASINAWGSLQQIDFFKTTPFHALLILPISFTGQFMLQRVTDTLRYHLTMADGKESEEEKIWDEETEEAEDDIMGLTLSFNMIQAIRFWNSGYLPDEEGKEPMDVLDGHSSAEIHRMWALALVFAVLLFIMNYVGYEEKEEGHGHGHGESHAEGHAEEGNGHGHVEEFHDESLALEGHHASKKGFFAELKERAWCVTLLAWSMGFAWACFYAGRMTLVCIPMLQDDMTLAVSLTLTISLVAFNLIRLLDIVADLECTGQQIDMTIFQVIRALGLLVGFGWEQTFDQAVEAISSSVGWPHLAKFVLAVFCIIVIVPAWYWYILKFAITDCWEWGFVVHDLDDPKEAERWKAVAKHIKDKREKHGHTGHDDHDVYKALTGDDNHQISDLTKRNMDLQKQNENLRKALESSVAALKECKEKPVASSNEVDLKTSERIVSLLREAEQIVKSEAS